MIRWSGITVAALALVALALPAAAETTGKDVFLAEKCNMCHSLSAAGIAKMGEEAGAAEKEEAEEPAAGETKKVPPPDLSGVSAKHKAEFIDGFLAKRETIDGRKHKRRFKGTPEDKKVLVDWLTTLKTPAKG